MLDTDDWVRRFHPATDQAMRLICLPHAGGSAPFFFPVSAALSPGIEVLAVQYPGRQDRRLEPLIDDLTVLSDAVLEAVLPSTDRPFALFGHSMGATVAFELATKLQAAGRPLERVFVSGRRAPSRHRDEQVHRLDDAGLIADLRQLSGTDTRVFGQEEVLRMVLPAIRNDYKAAETYTYRIRPPLTCPVTVLVGDSDPKVTVDEARDWQKHTTGPCDVRVFSGGHFYLIDHASEVIKIVSDQLAVSSLT